MASELTLSGLTIAFTKSGSPSVSLSPASLSITVAGAQIMDNVQNVGTTEEAILLGDVAAGGIVFAQNLDSTNFVSIRSGTGATNLIRINPGEWALFRLSGDASAPFAIADTAGVNVRFLRFDA